MENLYRNSAWLFDIDNRDNLTDDIPFYLEYAKQQQGDILELGCGTGRVALALAQEGFHVTGLDLSQQMLDVFREKLTTTPALADNITLVHGNMANYTIGCQFSMIIAPFRAFQALTNDNDIESSLACIHNHLANDGIFIINVFNPYPVMDDSWCYEETIEWEHLDKRTGNYVVRTHWGDRIDTVNQIIYPHFAHEITYPDGRKERLVDDLRMKYYYSPQLRSVIERADFKIMEEYSWYDKSPLEGREIIFVCKRKA